MNRSHAVRGMVGILAAALLAAGCAAPVPVPSPDPVPKTPPPVLTAEQDQAIVDAVGEAVGAADAAKDPALLSPRVAGPALTIRTAQIQIAAGLGKDDPLAPLPTDLEQVVITTTPTWPRTTYAMSTQPADTSSNRFMAFDQNAARDNYALWGWARLFPGTTLPKFAPVEEGGTASAASSAVAADDSSLLMTPQDAVAQYADVLNLGANSMFAATFADDPFRTAMATQANLWTTQGGLTAAGGTYSMSFVVDGAQPIHAVRTLDGGAVVMGALSATESIAAPEGAIVPPGNPTQQVLLGGAPNSHLLTVNYVEVVAIYVPKAGSTDPVRVLGIEHQAVAASR